MIYHNRMVMVILVCVQNFFYSFPNHSAIATQGRKTFAERSTAIFNNSVPNK